MYQSSKKVVTYKQYWCFDHSDFLAHSIFTFEVCWSSLGTSILGNSSSAASNTRSRLPSRLSFRFIWLWLLLDYCINWSKTEYYTKEVELSKTQKHMLSNSNLQILILVIQTALFFQAGFLWCTLSF